ncbi:MAG: hypothetical protein INQ03_06550 [Candidatus Heimdallarchaeota archaeon]|nr:hypothetical protein [Candidatus Heimdallarchaeota archaeon]
MDDNLINNATTQSLLIDLLQYYKSNHNNSEFASTWEDLWSDIILLVQSASSELFANLLTVFISWYSQESTICSLRMLQKAQQLRLDLLKLFI